MRQDTGITGRDTGIPGQRNMTGQEQSPPVSSPIQEHTTAEQDKAVETCRIWYTWDRMAKQSYIDEMDENDKLYTGKHWDILGPHGGPLRTAEQQKTRPNCVENTVFSLVEGLTAEFSQDIDLVFFPVEPNDETVAVTMTDLAKFIAYKNRINIERMRWLRNFFKHGTGIWEVCWDPHWRGGRGPNKWEGEVRWRSVHPRHFFPDARCQEDLETATRVHKAKYATLEYIRDRYPTYGQLAMTEVLDPTLLTLAEEDVPQAQWEMTLLVETWYIGEPLILAPGEVSQGPGLHVIWWCGEGRGLYLHHANYAYHDPGEEAKFPFVVKQRYQRDGSIWGYGEPFFLKQPQVALNKTAELILEGHMHHSVGMTIYQQGALSPEQRNHVRDYGTLPGMWHEVNDINLIRREFGSGVPASLQNETTRLQRSMENIVGRFDVAQGRTPGSVTAFRALDLLAQRAQVRLRSADVAITTGYEDVGRCINHLIVRNYTEARAYRIIGPNDKNRPDVVQRGVFNLAETQRAFDYQTGQAMPLSQYQPMADATGLMPGIDYEVYSPELDVEARTTTQMPSDRTFYLEMAKELYQGGLIQTETFYYVLEHGVFPPYEELLQQWQMQQQMQQMTAAGMPPGGGPPGSLPAGGALSQGGPSPSPGALPPHLAAMAQQMPAGAMRNVLKGPLAPGQVLPPALSGSR